MGDLAENLKSAKLAIDHVSRLKVRTNSRAEDSRRMTDEQWDALHQCLTDESVNSVRGQFKAYCKPLWPNQQTLPSDWVDRCVEQKPDAIKKLAELAEGKGCGNCNEQDAVAIVYLRDTLKVRPLDLMILNRYSGIDHTFVVIGRADVYEVPDHSKKLCNLFPSIDKDPTSWGPDAVVCDPWHDGGKAYPATEIQAKMFRGYVRVNNMNQPAPVRGAVQPASIWRIE